MCSRMGQNLWKTAFNKLGENITSRFFVDCLPQILLDPFLDTWSHITKYYMFVLNV